LIKKLKIKLKKDKKMQNSFDPSNTVSIKVNNNSNKFVNFIVLNKSIQNFNKNNENNKDNKDISKIDNILKSYKDNSKNIKRLRKYFIQEEQKDADCKNKTLRGYNLNTNTNNNNNNSHYLDFLEMTEPELKFTQRIFSKSLVKTPHINGIHNLTKLEKN